MRQVINLASMTSLAISYCNLLSCGLRLLSRFQLSYVRFDGFPFVVANKHNRILSPINFEFDPRGAPNVRSDLIRLKRQIFDAPVHNALQKELVDKSLRPCFSWSFCCRLCTK